MSFVNTVRHDPSSNRSTSKWMYAKSQLANSRIVSSFDNQLCHQFMWPCNVFGPLVTEEHSLHDQEWIPLVLVPLEHQPM